MSRVGTRGITRRNWLTQPIAGRHPATLVSRRFAAAVEHVRNILDNDTFDRHVATGAAMDTAEAVRYAHAQIQLVRAELAGLLG